jgi:hypothetical protein
VVIENLISVYKHVCRWSCTFLFVSVFGLMNIKRNSRVSTYVLVHEVEFWGKGMNQNAFVREIPVYTSHARFDTNMNSPCSLKLQTANGCTLPVVKHPSFYRTRSNCVQVGPLFELVFMSDNWIWEDRFLQICMNWNLSYFRGYTVVLVPLQWSKSKTVLVLNWAPRHEDVSIAYFGNMPWRRSGGVEVLLHTHS